jgi:hypothetical protein
MHTDANLLCRAAAAAIAALALVDEGIMRERSPLEASSTREAFLRVIERAVAIPVIGVQSFRWVPSRGPYEECCLEETLDVWHLSPFPSHVLGQLGCCLPARREDRHERSQIDGHDLVHVDGGYRDQQVSSRAAGLNDRASCQELHSPRLRTGRQPDAFIIGFVRFTRCTVIDSR